MKNPPEIHVTVSNKTLIRILVFIIGTILLFKFISNIIHPLTLIFVSIFLAIALNPFVNFVKKHLKIKKRGVATAVSYVTVIVVLGIFFALVIPPFIEQTIDFLKNIPNNIQNLQNSSGWIGDLIRRYNIGSELNKMAHDFSGNFGNMSGTALNIANRIVGNIISIITVLILTFMVLLEGPSIFNWFISQFPEAKGKRVRKIAKKMYDVVTGFVNGQVVVAMIAAFFALIALLIASSIIGVRINAVAIAALVAVFGMIPTIGNIINAFVITIVCMFASPTLAIVMLIYFVIYQQIENATIQPYVQSKTNELTPLIVFVAALLGIGFGGIMGGLVAIPLAGCIKILLEDWLDDRKYNASNL